MRLNLSKNAKLIIEYIEKAGFSCYVVGGCVRDLLLGKEPSDYDFTTNARPDDILKIFDNFTVYEVGKKFGTISVLIDNEKYEITTFRKDLNYYDSRHPDEVMFSDSLFDDLSRRDFTINAMAYNQKDGLIDLFNGVNDINNKIIRCVGYPVERFNEDALRILRALRFSSTLSFEIEKVTKESIFSLYKNLSRISVERISSELNQILLGENVFEVLNDYHDIIFYIIPELKSLYKFNQKSPHHLYDVYEHTLHTIINIENDLLLRMTMLLHDIAKPICFSLDNNNRGHFYGHPKISSEIANKVLNRLKYPKKFIHQVTLLINYHDYRFNGDTVLIKKVLSKLDKELFEKLIYVQKSDLMSQSDYEFEIKCKSIERTEKEFIRIINDNECYNLKGLKVNGKDILACAIVDESKIGYILNIVLNKVIDGSLNNNKKDILDFVTKNKESLTKK